LHTSLGNKKGINTPSNYPSTRYSPRRIEGWISLRSGIEVLCPGHHREFYKTIHEYLFLLSNNASAFASSAKENRDLSIKKITQATSVV
jgi:hypothetical protein